MLDSVRVVLVRSRNSLNIGAAARAMANFGIRDLVLVEPYDEAWRVAKSARAGVSVLASARVATTIAEAIAGCTYVVGTTAGTARVPELPLEDWETVARNLPAAPVALLFGSEKTGLGVEEISHCNRLARIPTLPGSASMNLGQAVAVCAYELARARRGALPPPVPLPGLASEEIERIVAVWYPLLERAGVVPPGHRPSETRLLREMLVRWRMTPRDQHRLLGIARQLKRLLPQGAE